GRGASERKGWGAVEGVGRATVGNAPERGLVAVDAAPRGRNSDGAAAVGALGQRYQPVGDGAPAAARRTAGILGGVEGIARRAEEVIVAGAAHTHDRAVRLADEDRAGLLDVLRESAVLLGDGILAGAHAAEGDLPARLVVE